MPLNVRQTFLFCENILGQFSQLLGSWKCKNSLHDRSRVPYVRRYFCFFVLQKKILWPTLQVAEMQKTQLQMIPPRPQRLANFSFAKIADFGTNWPTPQVVEIKNVTHYLVKCTTFSSD